MEYLQAVSLGRCKVGSSPLALEYLYSSVKDAQKRQLSLLQQMCELPFPAGSPLK